MKKVLFISYDGMTDPLGQSQVIPYLTGLAEKGFKIHILSCEKKKNFSENKKQIAELLRKNNIEWHPVAYTKSPPVLSTLWDVWRMKRKAIALHKKERFSIVHCRSYIPSLIGLYFKKKYSHVPSGSHALSGTYRDALNKNCSRYGNLLELTVPSGSPSAISRDTRTDSNMKFIFDMRGFWADERVDGHLWNTEKYIYKKIYQYFKAKEKEFLILSDKVISLTENAKQEMLTWNIAELNANKITVIPCAADEKVFTLKTKETQKAAKQKLNIREDEFVLSYIGSLGTWYLPDEMLRFFSMLKSIKPKAKFLFLTPDKKEYIVQIAKKYSLSSDDVIVRFSPRSDLASYAHASDASIFFIKPSYSKKSSCPTKMGELLTMGIPIITNGGVGDVEDILKKTKSGICVSDFSKKAFEDAILEMEALLKLSPEEIRASSSDYFQLSRGLNSYLSVYNEL